MKGPLSSTLIYVIFFLTYHFHRCNSDSLATVDYETGAYTNIVVAISPDVEVSEPEEQQIISNIKALFRDGSHVLKELTIPSLIFKEVFILIPPKWITKPDKPSEKETFVDADVRIDTPNEKYKDTPYTVQPGECGQRAQFVHLSRDYILRYHLGKDTFAARRFVQQWCQYRFGVFPETGLEKSQLFPNHYTDSQGNIKKTGCSNPYPWKLKNCKIVDEVEQCDFLRENDNPTISSFMDDVTLEAKTSCTKKSHNSEAPTLQNRLCNGRSIQEVFETTVDSNATGDPDLITKDINFTVVGGNPVQTVFIIDRTLCVNRSSISFLFKKVLLSESFLKSAAFILADTASNQMFHKTNVVKGWDSFCQGTERGDVTIGITHAERILNNTSGIAIFLNNGRASSDFTKIVKTFEVYPNYIRRYIINFLEERKTSVHVSIMTEFRKAKVELFNVMSELACDMDGIRRSEIIIQNILRYQQNNGFEAAEKTLFSGVYNGEMLTGEFTPLNFNTKVNLELLFCEVQSKTPQIKYTFDTMFLSFEPNSDMQEFYVMETTAQKDTSNFELNFGINSFVNTVSPYYLRLTTEKNSISTVHMETFLEYKDDGAFLLRAWLQNKKNPNLYGKVTARFESETDPSYTITFDLHDDGNGDPDILKDDGIHSTYIIPPEKRGLYTLTVFNSPTYSLSDSTDTKNVSGTSLGSFYFDNRMDDTFPPNSIMDLRIKSPSVSPVTFAWTAPGDDYDQGKATRYEMKCSKTKDDVSSQSRFDKLDNKLISLTNAPSISGSEEKFDWLVPDSLLDEVAFCAIQALDSSGNRGSLSQPLRIYLASTTTQSDSTAMQTSESSTEVVYPEPTQGYIDLRSVEGLIIGFSITLTLLMLAILGFLVYVHLIKGRSRYQENERPNVVNEQERPNTFNEQRRVNAVNEQETDDMYDDTGVTSQPKILRSTQTREVPLRGASRHLPSNKLPSMQSQGAEENIYDELPMKRMTRGSEGAQC